MATSLPSPSFTISIVDDYMTPTVPATFKPVTRFQVMSSEPDWDAADKRAFRSISCGHPVTVTEFTINMDESLLDKTINETFQINVFDPASGINHTFMPFSRTLSSKGVSLKSPILRTVVKEDLTYAEIMGSQMIIQAATTTRYSSGFTWPSIRLVN